MEKEKVLYLSPLVEVNGLKENRGCCDSGMSVSVDDYEERTFVW